MQAIEKIEYILNSTAYNTTNHQIAEILYNNLRKIPVMSLQEAADLCSVSVSTFMRFLKSTGYSLYPVFQSAISTAIADYNYRSIFVPRHLAGETGQQTELLFLDLLTKEIDQIKKNIDFDNLHAICEAIHASKRVVIVSVSNSANLITSVLRAAFALDGKETLKMDLIMPDATEGYEPLDTDFNIIMMAESPGNKPLRELLKRLHNGYKCKNLVICNIPNYSGHEYSDYNLTLEGNQAYVDYFAMNMLTAVLSITYRTMYQDELMRAD